LQGFEDIIMISSSLEIFIYVSKSLLGLNHLASILKTYNRLILAYPNYKQQFIFI